MEESGFPAGEVRLLDEEPLAGTVTDVAGEATVIQPIDEDSFDRAWALRIFCRFAELRCEKARFGQRRGKAGATVDRFNRRS